jgi:hypothetical protein
MMLEPLGQVRVGDVGSAEGDEVGQSGVERGLGGLTAREAAALDDRVRKRGANPGEQGVVGVAFLERAGVHVSLGRELVDQMQVGGTSATQMLGRVEQGFLDVRVFRHGVEPAVGSEANASAPGTQFAHRRVDDFHQESRAIFDIAASCSGRRGVEHGVHELVEQIAVGRVDFHTVETGPPRIGEGLRKGRCFGVNPTLR